MATLNSQAESQLALVGYDQFTLNRIKSNDYLINQINAFISFGGNFLKTLTGEQGAYYNPETKNIHFEPFSNYISYRALAHELGHALGQNQAGAPSAYDSAKSYAFTRSKGEAEAIYNEFITIEYEIKQNGIIFDKTITQNLYSIIKDLTKEQAYDFLSKLNMYTMIRSDNNLNYYENDVLVYLFDVTDFNIDLVESGYSSNNMSFFSHMINYDTLGDRYDNHIDALAAYNRESLLPGHIKTMLNDSAYMYGDAGNDILKGTAYSDIILGGSDNDKLYGRQGNDALYGNSGDDMLQGGEGEDELYGQTGNDILYGGLGQDTIQGHDGNDKIYGGNDSDVLYGHTGVDTIFGEAGNDVIGGGADADKLSGGAGTDYFAFTSNIDNSVDTITDFAAGIDFIWLEDSVFSAVGEALDAAEFALGNIATAAGQHILFNKDDGALYYDADSIGGEAAVQFATVSGSNLSQFNHNSFAII